MKKSRIIIIIGIFFILFIGYGFGIYKINTQFKQVELKEIPVETEYEIINGLKMKVNKISCIDKNELYQSYGYEMDYEGEIKAFLVTVTYINESKNIQKIATYNNNIEKAGYSNGIEPILYSMCNSGEIDFELKSGEKREVILPYILMDFQFTNQKWKKIKEDDFYLTTSRYPVKTVWLLK